MTRLLLRIAAPGAALLALLPAAGPAAASGGLTCTARDGAVELDVSSGVSRGMGGALFQFRGTLRIRAGGIAPDLARTAFEREHVAHSWLSRDEVRLLLYREREGDAPHGFVEVTILTRSRGTGLRAAGTYAVTVHDVGGTGEGRTFRGRAECALGE